MDCLAYVGSERASTKLRTANFVARTQLPYLPYARGPLQGLAEEIGGSAKWMSPPTFSASLWIIVLLRGKSSNRINTRLFKSLLPVRRPSIKPKNRHPTFFFFQTIHPHQEKRSLFEMLWIAKAHRLKSS